MAIVFDSDAGTISGLSVGGLPDGVVDAGSVAADVATQAEIDAKLNLAGGALTGDVTLTHGSGPQIKIEETGGSYIEVEAGGSTGHIKSKSGHDITFSPGGTNRLQLYSSGRASSDFTARAWLRYNGSTNAVGDSHNISSVTDNSSGNYTMNFDADLPSANYVATGCAPNSNDATDGSFIMAILNNVGSCKIIAHKHDGNNHDRAMVQVIVFGG